MDKKNLVTDYRASSMIQIVFYDFIVISHIKAQILSNALDDDIQTIQFFIFLSMQFE